MSRILNKKRIYLPLFLIKEEDKEDDKTATETFE